MALSVGLAALPWEALGGLSLGSLLLAIGAVSLSIRRGLPVVQVLRQS